MRRFGFTILGLAIVFGVISVFRVYQDSSPTPSEAISNYIARVTNNAPGKVDAIAVVSSVYSNLQGNEPIILFRGKGQDPQIHIAGYAIVRKSLFGWYVEKLQMVGRSSLPNDIMVKLDWFDGGQVIFGQVFLANATSVEAIFSDPNKSQIIISADIPNGNFVIFGSKYDELLEFKILDSTGNVLKQLTKDELQNG